MNVVLPDVSQTEAAPHLAPLKWVGMQGIDVPVRVDESDHQGDIHARVDLQVDLPIPHVKGIHMSRLYRLLDSSLAAGEAVNPASLHNLLAGMIETHIDCDSKCARVRMLFDLLVRRPALISEELAGWKSYPVELEALIVDGEFRIRVAVTVEYSSTCPCSAALSRQLIEQRFLEDFSVSTAVDTKTVAAWLREHATSATPHSQRSEAKVSIVLNDLTSEQLGLRSLIDQIEEAVSTPVQTAVKRADEQAFAGLNGQNLMFVEDAARRIRAALGSYQKPEVFVRHLESLHPHDAVAWSAG